MQKEWREIGDGYMTTETEKEECERMVGVYVQLVKDNMKNIEDAVFTQKYYIAKMRYYQKQLDEFNSGIRSKVDKNSFPDWMDYYHNPKCIEKD